MTKEEGVNETGGGGGGRDDASGVGEDNSSAASRLLPEAINRTSSSEARAESSALRRYEEGLENEKMTALEKGFENKKKIVEKTGNYPEAPTLYVGSHAVVGGGTKGKNSEKPSYLQYLDNKDDEDNEKAKMTSPSYIEYLDKDEDNEKDRMASPSYLEDNGEARMAKPPSYLSYLDKDEDKEKARIAPEPSYLSYLDHHSGPMALPGPGTERSSTNRGPMPLPDTERSSGDPRNHTPEPGAYPFGRDIDPPSVTMGGGEEGEVEAPSQALPVATEVDDNERPSMNPTAQGYDVAEEQRRREEQHRKRNLCAGVGILALVAIMTVVVAVAVTQSGSTTNDDVVYSSTSSPSMSPTTSPTRPLPPMENLELLYDSLPEKMKQSLYNIDSPQYQAWDWLVNHPNITTYPEWRKEQIYSMATFFLSLEGHNWPEETPNRGTWLNVSMSECSWGLTVQEQAYFAHLSFQAVGASAQTPQAHQTCNEKGEVQTIILHSLYLPTNANPSIPPEIQLLTSLRILTVANSQINAKLSDIVVPEVIDLPSLESLNLQDSGVSGTIPKEISQMKDLRHLIIGANKLSGAIPTQIASMNSLEYIFVSHVDGQIPSELGKMTALSGLLIYESPAFTGTIPTELGLLTNIVWLNLWGTRLTGQIPSELGMMTSITSISLRNNALTGTVPSELGLMTNANTMRLGNVDADAQSSKQNVFTGSLPKELWELSHMKLLYLQNLPKLSGSIPTRIMMPNLTTLNLGGSPLLSGIIPEQICFIPELDFDCSDLLCGCDCPCEDGSSVTNESNPFVGSQSTP